jgi:isocitrate/isopropylmalate dehydrogenase
MLENLGYHREAGRIESAVRRSVELRQTTPDLGGTLGTEAVGDWVSQEVARQS